MRRYRSTTNDNRHFEGIFLSLAQLTLDTRELKPGKEKEKKPIAVSAFFSQRLRFSPPFDHCNVSIGFNACCCCCFLVRGSSSSSNLSLFLLFDMTNQWRERKSCEEVTGAISHAITARRSCFSGHFSLQFRSFRIAKVKSQRKIMGELVKSQCPQHCIHAKKKSWLRVIRRKEEPLFSSLTMR